MINCPKCNSYVNGTVRFCTNCGVNFKEYFDEISKNATCDKCGAKIEKNARFCGECGNQITIKNATILSVDDDFEPASTCANELFQVKDNVLIKYTGKKRMLVVSNVEKIGDNAFYGDDMLRYVDVERGIKGIGKGAFANCSSLVEISIPSSCNAISNDAFLGTNIELLILPEKNNEIIKCVLSTAAREYVSDAEYDEFITVKHNQAYVDIKSIEERAAKIEKIAKLKKQKVGSSLKFGSYYLNNSTKKEPIEWIILAKEQNRALIISKYVLCGVKYNDTQIDVSWGNSTLRNWLNGYFINCVFNSDEQSKIYTTKNLNLVNSVHRTHGGSTTEDKIFLLSEREAEKYFKTQKDRIGKPSSYAVAKGVYKDKFGGCFWWLRTPGVNKSLATYVSGSGEVSHYGNIVDNSRYGVRPAMWIDLA